MKRFTESELLSNLPPSQLEISKQFLKKDPASCMICGDKNGRQILLNGLPSQLCEDCIEIQKGMYNSET